MNYEDKYKKLVDAIKVLKESRTSDKDFQDWVKDNVPELQEEPESERIKNCLLYLASVEDIADDAFESYNVDYDSVSSWIKKYGGTACKDPDPCQNEPGGQRFEVDDWVLWTDGNIPMRIVSLDDIGYETDAGFIPFYHDEHLRLWSIDDARDGDILTNGDIIVIFKKFEEPAYRQHIVAHIGLDTTGDIQVTDETWELGIDNARPATKEQRDLLYREMTRAGYVWDHDAKELKIARQKYEENIVRLNRIVSLLENMKVPENDILRSDIDWLKSLRNREITGQALDQKTIESIVYYLENAKKHYASTTGLEACIDLLRSIELV